MATQNYQQDTWSHRNASYNPRLSWSGICTCGSRQAAWTSARDGLHDEYFYLFTTQTEAVAVVLLLFTLYNLQTFGEMLKC